MKSRLPTLVLSTPQEYNQSSYAHAGLFELKKSGYIDLKVKFNSNLNRGRFSVKDGVLEHSQHVQPKTSFYVIITPDGREIQFALDMYDIPYYFSSVAVEECDYIFKRNYESKYISVLSEQMQLKIHPFGLTFPVLSSTGQKGILQYSAMMYSRLKQIDLDRRLLSNISNVIRRSHKHWKYLDNDRLLVNFKSARTSTEPYVLFQTRCFDRLKDPDVVALNEQRAEIIRGLRRSLNGRFRGGLVPDKTSEKYYSDCITNIPTRHSEYIEVVRNAGVVIYTRGLQNSPAWKMAEYLSQGKCIVAEPMTTELPSPLLHNKHLMYFNTLDECIEICEYLINNPQKRIELSRNAREYYEHYVNPEKNMKRILDKMLNEN